MRTNGTLPCIYQAGLDVGSTTAKLVVLDHDGTPWITKYLRHGADVVHALSIMFEDAARVTQDFPVYLSVSGSAGLGLAENAGIPFIQEVIAAGDVIRRYFPKVSMMIDIGGEDSKMMFLPPNRPPDIRMNGNCAGGTGAFIDQMAGLLDLSLGEMNELADQHSKIYPIASRCGVFAKTDIQNLLSRNVDRADICASILHAVILQNLATLARGIDIQPVILLCGGPLTFLSSLRHLLQQSLQMTENDVILPRYSEFLPAWGAALASRSTGAMDSLRGWKRRIQIQNTSQHANIRSKRLSPLFRDDNDFCRWESRRAVLHVPSVAAEQAVSPLSLGIDSGSTTTKLLALDADGRVVFRECRPNRGDPVVAVAAALQNFQMQFSGSAMPPVAAASVTGYGEDLIRAAFDLEIGVVETVAHWRAAAQCNPAVSFILDIGGQDMKAIFVQGNGIRRIEINEACSSGCGSFIEGFAQTLGLCAGEFADRACRSQAPCDLGTRCTVFMNSRIKQAQRENATIEDIAAGLAYAVVKNSLYKVLKLREPAQLGDHIVVQGGTFRNRAVVRALELLTGRSVSSSQWPEMMGAYGAALLAQESLARNPSDWYAFDWRSFSGGHSAKTRTIQCSGCTNQCTVTIYNFQSGRKYFVGNKCERVFSNRGSSRARGANLFAEKNRLLFERSTAAVAPAANVRIGIPRILGMFETFPFWNTLLTGCGFSVLLSAPSEQSMYEKGLRSIMSDNICFPAKLAHGHIVDLLEKKVDRIFYPHVVHELRRNASAANSYNCPIVSAYAEVLKGALGFDASEMIPFDSPQITFADPRLLKKACRRYMMSLGVSHRRFRRAFSSALTVQEAFRDAICRHGKELLTRPYRHLRTVVVLAGRPYHADPLIEHQTSEILADFDVDVLPADAVCNLSQSNLKDLITIPQWSFPNRMLQAAQWVADQADPHIQFVMINSFGCGPDAFIMDEISDVLTAAGKIFTLIKVDDISSTGSVRLRLRSLIETLRWRSPTRPTIEKKRLKTPPYQVEDRGKTIIVPHFADCYAPFFSPVFKLLGHNLHVLPPSDEQSVEYGMRYTNNEVCYPAIVIVGDIIKAFASGRYDPDKTVAAMTQTGGQCRATSYVAVIQKALISAGFRQVPVIAVTAGGSRINDQPGLELETRRMIRPAFVSLLFADAIARMSYRSIVRERQPGGALQIRDRYLKIGADCCASGNTDGLLELLRGAVEDFNNVITGAEPLPRIGIVGEIFLKYNRFSHMHVVDWMMAQGIEVTVPSLVDFFMQYFVNAEVNRKLYLETGGWPVLLERFLEIKAVKWNRRFEKILQRFALYEPATGIHQKAGAAADIVSLANQYGEGWLIPAEIAGFSAGGIQNIVCLQPFGCIANHVIAKGIERKVKVRYPDTQLLFLDFDAGTSEVNVLNRLHFMIDHARESIGTSGVPPNSGRMTA